MRRIPLVLASALATLLLVLQPSIAFAAQLRRTPVVETFWTGPLWFEGFAVSNDRIAVSRCGTPYELEPDGRFEFRAWPRPECWHLTNPSGAGNAFSWDGSEAAVLLNHGIYSHGFLSVYETGSPSYTLRHTAGFFDLEAFENPDRYSRYGVAGGEKCFADAGLDHPSWTGSTGVIRWNSAHTVAPFRQHSWLVADSGAQAVWKVDANGTPSTFAVLPPVPTRVTADLAARLGWPACAVGLRNYGQPGPYEIETGRSGKIYIAGGGARLYRINPRSGAVRTLPYRFEGQLDLTVGRHGELYVAELATGQISVIRHGRIRPYVKVPDIYAIETDERGRLWGAIPSPPYDPNQGIVAARILRILNR